MDCLFYTPIYGHELRLKKQGAVTYSMDRENQFRKM